MLQSVSQAASEALHLNAWFARNRHGHKRLAESEFLPLLQTHDVDTIQHNVLVDGTGLKVQLIQYIPREEQNLPPSRRSRVVISLEASENGVYRPQRHRRRTLLGLDEYRAHRCWHGVDYNVAYVSSFKLSCCFSFRFLQHTFGSCADSSAGASVRRIKASQS